MNVGPIVAFVRVPGRDGKIHRLRMPNHIGRMRHIG